MPETPLLARIAGPDVRPERRSLAAATAYEVAGIALEFARPWPLALAVDYAIAGRPLLGLSGTGLLVAAAAGLVAVSALAGVVEMAAVGCAERSAERVGGRLRQRVFDRALLLSARWHDTMRSGELVSRLTSDVGRVLDAIVAVTAGLVPDTLRVLLVVGVLVAFDPVLALVALAVLPLLTGFAVRQRRRVRAAQSEARARSGELASTASDLLRNVRTVQAFGRSARAARTYRDQDRRLVDAASRAVTTEARWTPVADVVLALGSGLVLVVGGREVLAGRLSTGDLLVVSSYLAALYGPVRSLTRLSGVLAKSAASAARLEEILSCTDVVADRPGALPARPVREDVRFVGVRFGYDPSRPVLSGFDLTLHAGDTVALLGPSGVGKSTALQLLLRLYDVDAGSVRLDGVDVRDIERAGLLGQVAYVPQDPWLLDASIADNIAFGVADATWHGIRRAAEVARVDEFVRHLPAGYDTVVGEAGGRLSGGQKRRIALARALLSDASVLLLDEPTASLDPVSSAAVIDAVRAAAVGRTVLLVTHDRDLADIADRVVVLKPPAAERMPLPQVTPSTVVEGR